MAPSATGDKPLTKLTVEKLQQRYQDVVGRSTGSSHRQPPTLLIWKIRQAEKGKVPVGPRKRRSPDEPAPEFKVLPLRMEAELGPGARGDLEISAQTVCPRCMPTGPFESEPFWKVNG